MALPQSTAENHNITITNESLENILRISGNDCNKKNCIIEGIQKRFNTWNPYYRHRVCASP
jgi:hypothetical protein